MPAIKERAELETELTWDLSPMYASENDWEKEFAELEGLLNTFLAGRGHLADSPARLLAAFQAEDALSLQLERLGVYAHLKADENTADPVNQSRLDRIAARSAEIAGACAWFQPELLAMDEARFTEYLNDPVLAFYRRTLAEIGEERKHTLSAPEERILSLASDVLGTPDKVFSLLNDADLRFPVVADEHGEKCEVTHGNYLKFLESSDRSVRKNAFIAVYDTYAGLKNTLAALLDAQVKTQVLEARLRAFPSALACSLFADRVPPEVYENLIAAVRRGLPLLHGYFALRARALKLDRLDMYDLHTPLTPECRLEFPWPEAVKTVRTALRALGEEYGAALDQAFAKRWIDVPECRGKRSGAYSSGAYGRPPYLLLNHNGTLDSVFTLAHELGHSMHSFFSDRQQEFHYASYKIFVAEVASTTNELLLLDYLLKQTAGPKMKAYLLNHLADQFRTTVYRQTMFAEFERDVHALSEQGTPLTAELLGDRYYQLNALYHGDAVAPDERIKYEWARIPHFYYDFYVYQYATGFAAATALSRRILTGETEPYLNFLKAGDSRNVLDILKEAGVDFLGGDPAGDALKLFGGTVSQLEKALGDAVAG